MTTKAISFEGTILDIGQGDATTVNHATDIFDKVGEISDANLTGTSTPIIDASHSESPAVEKLAGLIDNGQLTFTANWVGDDAGQLSIEAARKARALRNIRLTLPSSVAANTYEFKGIITSFDLGGALGDKITATGTIDISGDRAQV